MLCFLSRASRPTYSTYLHTYTNAPPLSPTPNPTPQKTPQGGQQAGLHGALRPRWAQGAGGDGVRVYVSMYICIYIRLSISTPQSPPSHHTYYQTRPPTIIQLTPTPNPQTTNSYQFAERLTHSGLLPPAIQTLRKLDLGSLARAALHLREPSNPPTTDDDDQGERPQYHHHHALGSPIQEGEDEDAASPVHRSVGGIHGCSPSSSSSVASSSSLSSSTTMVHVDVGIAILQSPNPALLAALGRYRKEGEEGAPSVGAAGATTAGLTSMGKGGSSRGPSRSSSVITGATDLESPLSSPALSAASSAGEEGV